MCQDMEQFKHLVHKCENQSSDSQELTLIEGWYDNLPIIPAQDSRDETPQSKLVNKTSHIHDFCV